MGVDNERQICIQWKWKLFCAELTSSLVPGLQNSTCKDGQTQVFETAAQEGSAEVGLCIQLPVLQLQQKRDVHDGLGA